MEYMYRECPPNMPMPYPSRGFNCHDPDFTENAHLLHHGWQPAGQLFGQQVHNKRRWLQQQGTGLFPYQDHRPRDTIFVHGGEEILVSEAFNSERYSIAGSSKLSSHALGARRVSSRYDAGHEAYGVVGLPRHNVDGLIQIGGQQFKWVPLKSRDCNQSVTGSDALGAIHDIIKSLDTFTIRHISREENFRANHLAQQASGFQVTSGKILIIEKPMLAVVESETNHVASSVLGQIESSGAEKISSFGVQGASSASLVQQ
ncbi:unnamed protein product [Miscanthus lutarioriparius]|uniref:Uncharacterized protein n=1 Tax=Miscanthus lutarioriparius TaxID=422564 RepID=A0A811R575_9POAL|nr:unnamed protein product [Miscanthus lutarioriparius]